MGLRRVGRLLASWADAPSQTASLGEDAQCRSRRAQARPAMLSLQAGHATQLGKVFSNIGVKAMPARKAQEVLQRYWDRTLPVNPEQIATAAGIEVEYSNDLDGCSGEYCRKGERVRIFVNANEASVRQRFTLAHELGHHFMNHGPAFRDGPAAFSVRPRDRKEVEANRFAAELLMPRDAVGFAIHRWNKKTLAELADTFHVSQLAMDIRLQTLGIVR